MLRDQFIEGFSHAAATVNVVTTDGNAGRAGVTVSAMCSVSADPPSLLVCVHHKSSAADIIRENGVFCVNVLRDDQSFISDAFAGRGTTAGGDKFSCAQWETGVTGAPALADGLVAFDCHTKQSFQSGSHWIFIADVVDIAVREARNPLIYANRAYGVPAKLPPPVPPRVDTGQEGRGSVSVGCFVTVGPFFVPRLLESFASRSPGVDVVLHEGVQDDLVDGLERSRFDLVLTYDVGVPGRFEVERLAEVAPHALLPAGHPLASAQAVRLQDLAREPMVLLDIPPSREYFTSLFAEVGVEPRIGWRSPSFEMVRGLVGNGLGYSLLVTKPANRMSYDGRALVARPIADRVTPGRIVLARAAGRTAHPQADAFAAHCKAFFSGAPMEQAA